MKKRWKIFWIVSAVLVLLGFACCIIAFSLGASLNDVTTRYYDYQVHSSESYSNVNELNIDVTGTLNIITHDKDTILVETSGGSSRWEVSCKQSGGELRIKTKLWFNWGGTTDHGTINVYVPEGYQFTEADIALGAGRADVEEINADELKLEVGAGEGVLYSFVTKGLKMNCGAGRIEANGVLNGDAKVEAGVGEAVLDLAGTEEDFNYDIECGVGKVSVGSSSHSGLASERKIDNRSDQTIDINCGVGNINVDFY